MSKIHSVRTDCKWFKGHVPCIPHKQQGHVCPSCPSYERIRERIFVIKLGAAGDVIRTTPLLHKLRERFPQAEITWLTYFPDLVPKSRVNKVLVLNLENIVWLKAQKFDWLINLDKDDPAIALASAVSAKRKSGFGMDHNGKCKPFGSAAEHHKWMTGLWDDLNRSNTKNYMEEIFAICGYEFHGEEYILEKVAGKDWEGLDRTKQIAGLNTGCGDRWTTRLWSEKSWIELARNLVQNGFEVALLGGPGEHERNTRIAGASGAKYFGHFELPVFIDLVDQCHIIVSQVTMAMHLAIALKKQLYLINNIFNRHEFFLYGKGAVIEPPGLSCLGCFKQKFDSRCPVANCMDLIEPRHVFDQIANNTSKERM